jgi:hypothetical protein
MLGGVIGSNLASTQTLPSFKDSLNAFNHRGGGTFRQNGGYNRRFGLYSVYSDRHRTAIRGVDEE